MDRRHLLKRTGALAAGAALAGGISAVGQGAGSASAQDTVGACWAEQQRIIDSIARRAWRSGAVATLEDDVVPRVVAVEMSLPGPVASQLDAVLSDAIVLPDADVCDVVTNGRMSRSAGAGADENAIVTVSVTRVALDHGAPRSGLVVGPDAEQRAARLGLPREYIAVPGTLEPRKGLVDVFTALGRRGVPDIPVVVLGPESWGDQHVAEVAEELGVAASRTMQMMKKPAEKS